MVHIRIKLRGHPGDVAMVGKTVVAIIADNYMFVNRDTHDPAGEYQLTGYRNVFSRRLWIPGGMVVGKYKGSCFVSEG